MALESTTYISGLVATNPVTGDGVNQGDDHLRLIKASLLATFPNVAGAVTPTHTELNYVDGVTSAIQTQLDAKVAASRFPNVSGDVTPTHTELNYVDGVTSAIQTQIDSKLNASRFPNVSGDVTPTHTELNYVDGVTSAIQTQLDAKAPLASPTFTGTPLAPTAAGGTNTTQVATTAFVKAAIDAIPEASFSGVTHLGTITTTSGTSQSLGTLDLTSYKFLRLVLSSVGSSSGNHFLVGNSTSDDVQCTPETLLTSSDFDGCIEIDLATGVGWSNLMQDSTPGTYAFISALRTSSTAVSFASSSSSFDEGSIRVYGIK